MISKTGELVCEFCGIGEKDIAKKWPRVWEVPKYWTFMGGIFNYYCCEICMVKFHRLLISKTSDELKKFDILSCQVVRYKNGGSIDTPFRQLKDLYDKEFFKVKKFLEEKMCDNLSTARGTEIPQGV